MTNTGKYIIAGVSAVIIGMTGGAYATSSSGNSSGQQQQHHGGPGGGSFKLPQEMIDACSGKAKGDACSFTDKRRSESVDGTCDTPPGQSTLGCKPSKMPEGGKKGGPGGENGGNGEPPAPPSDAQ